MGQYYFPTILRRKGNRNFSKQFYSHQYDNGLKLMEHSYIGNHFVNTVLAQLYNNPGRLAWIGDYHENGDMQDKELEKAFYKAYNNFNKENGMSHYTKAKEVENAKGRFILNHDKKVFIDMKAYEEKAHKDEFGCAIHPLPLLTAVGNGRGGGDYWGINEEDVGIWAGDLIETQDAKPNGYTDVTNEIEFEEGR